MSDSNNPQIPGGSQAPLPGQPQGAPEGQGPAASSDQPPLPGQGRPQGFPQGQAQPQAPFQGQPQGSPTGPGQPQGPFPGQPQSQAPFPGQPQAPFQGQPQGSPRGPGQPQGAFPGQPQGAFPGQPQGAFPGQAQAPFQGQPQTPTPSDKGKGKGLKGWMIALIAVGGVVVLTGLTFLILFLVGAGPFAGDKVEDQIAAELVENPELKPLYEACATGDMAACDSLFIAAPSGSALEIFGNDCGGVPRTGMWCDPAFDPATGDDDSDFDIDELIDEEDVDDRTDSTGSLSDLPADFDSFDQVQIAVELDENPDLTELYQACAAGDMAACDDLYFQSGIGTELEKFADTCGGRSFDGGYCDAD